MRRLSDPRTTEEELMSVLGLFLLGQNYFDRQISALSGGERSRLALAVLFLARCNFLILDEPTNHLDLESREALAEALESYDGTLLLVAHDRYLLSTCVDEVWEVTPDGFVIYENGFEEYEEARQKEKQKSKIMAVSTQSTDTASPIKTNLSREEQKRIKREQAEQRNALSKELKPLQQQYEALEKQMEETLAKQTELEELLASQEVYEDGQRAAQLLKDFHAIQIQAEQELEELSALEEKINALKEKAKAIADD